MTANSVVRARIDERIKNEAAAVLAAMGLTVSDAFRLMMIKIAKEKALPFEPLVPNEETIEAMKAARRAGDRRAAGEAAREPECGLLNTLAVLGATTSGKSRDGTASALTPICWQPSPCWRKMSRCPDGISITRSAASGTITAIATSDPTSS